MKNLKIRQFILSIALLNTTDAMESEEHTYIPEAIKSNNVILAKEMLSLARYLITLFQITINNTSIKSVEDFNTDTSISISLIFFIKDFYEYWNLHSGKFLCLDRDSIVTILQALHAIYHITFPNDLSKSTQLKLLTIMYNIFSKIFFQSGEIEEIPCSFTTSETKSIILTKREVCKPDKSEIFEALLTLPVEEKLLQIFYKLDVAMDWHTWVRSWFSIMNKVLEKYKEKVEKIFPNNIATILISLRIDNKHFLNTWSEFTKQEFNDYCSNNNIDEKTYTEGLQKINTIAKRRLSSINNELDKFENKYNEILNENRVIKYKTGEIKLFSNAFNTTRREP